MFLAQWNYKDTEGNLVSVSTGLFEIIDEAIIFCSQDKNKNLFTFLIDNKEVINGDIDHFSYIELIHNIRRNNITSKQIIMDEFYSVKKIKYGEISQNIEYLSGKYTYLNNK